MDANNTFSPDAKYVLQTSDNANILVTAQGHAPHEHLTFETGSDAYKWLNNVVAVAVAQQVATGIASDVWQVGSSQPSESWFLQNADTRTADLEKDGSLKIPQIVIASISSGYLVYVRCCVAHNSPASV